MTASATSVSATQITLKDILFATDFSEGSEHALPYLRMIAKAFKSAVHLCHIEHSIPLAGSAAAPEVYRTAGKVTAERLTVLLNAAALRGLNLNLALGSGAIKDELLNIIRDRNIDLVMAGTHGRAGDTKSRLGAVAEEIICAATCPVLTVGRPTAPRRESPFANILFPMELDEPTPRILLYVFLFAKAFNAHLTVLHVADTAQPGSNGALRQSLEKSVMERLPTSLTSLKPGFMVECGDPAETVLRVAHERNIDLIAVQITGDFASSAELRSSTAYRIIAGADCPVLTLR